jgi:hypothetical protein
MTDLGVSRSAPDFGKQHWGNAVHCVVGTRALNSLSKQRCLVVQHHQHQLLPRSLCLAFDTRQPRSLPCVHSMLAAGLSRSRTIRSWRTGPSPARPRRLRCPSAYSSDALAAIKVAREEAIRQGSMFVSPQHLLVGLTAGASTAACALLQQQGITVDTLRQTLDSDTVVPLSSSYLQARDTDFSPESRQLLSAAAQSGTGHKQGSCRWRHSRRSSMAHNNIQARGSTSQSAHARTSCCTSDPMTAT